MKGFEIGGLAVNSPIICRESCGDSFAVAENVAHSLRMKRAERIYIWQRGDWPAWRYDLAKLVG